MKYKILYDTMINKEHKCANEIIEFPKGTDSGYITRLIKMGVIELDSENAESTESKRGKKGKNSESKGADSENADSENAENEPDSENSESK